MQISHVKPADPRGVLGPPGTLGWGTLWWRLTGEDTKSCSGYGPL